jgi:hypothetical protein
MTLRLKDPMTSRMQEPGVSIQENNTGRTHKPGARITDVAAQRLKDTMTQRHNG